MLFAVVVEVWRSGSVQCVSSNFFCDGIARCQVRVQFPSAEKMA